MSKAWNELRRLASRGQLSSKDAAAALSELYASGQTDAEIETLLLGQLEQADLVDLVGDMHERADREQAADRDAEAELEEEERAAREEAERQQAEPQMIRAVRFEEIGADADRVRYRVHFADRAPAELVLIREAGQMRVETEPMLQARVIESEELAQVMHGGQLMLEKQVRLRVEIAYAGGTHGVDVPPRMNDL